MELRERIAGLAEKYQGDWTSIAKGIATKEEVSPASFTVAYVTLGEAHYPRRLRDLRYPPWILFYVGQLALLDQPSVSIVGSRNLSPYGASVTRWIAESCSKKYCLVSGLAKGADGIVHATAIEEGCTIGVIGSGLDIQYPKVNASLYEAMALDHLILSEYPPGTPPYAHHFPWRNRLIAALSPTLVVTSASLKSGTMLTANEANNLGKTIYCIPHPLGDPRGEGCNTLISQGAQILLKADDLGL